MVLIIKTSKMYIINVAIMSVHYSISAFPIVLLFFYPILSPSSIAEKTAEYAPVKESEFYLWLLAQLAVGRRVSGRIHLLWRAIFLLSKNNVSH